MSSSQHQRPQGSVHYITYFKVGQALWTGSWFAPSSPNICSALFANSAVTLVLDIFNESLRCIRFCISICVYMTLKLLNLRDNL